MSIEEIKALEIESVEERAQAIETEMSAENADLEALSAEMDALIERKNELKAIAEQRKQEEAKALEARKVVEDFQPTTIQEERKMDFNSKEYRDLFYGYLANPTEEKRNALINVDGSTDGTVTGDAIALPKSLDEKIWDNIHTAHPILADVASYDSGVVLEVTKHTAIAQRVAGKKDADTTAAAEDNTFVKVSLAGVDYEKYVELTYAEAKMSQGALEDYLAQEISAELGEALAKDVFTQILSDATTAQKVTKTADLFEDIKAALGKANMGGKKTIYAPSTEYYNIVGAIKSGSPFNIGTTLGVEVKCDDAATGVVVLDPKMFILNNVCPVSVESDKDIKAHKVVVSGYLRAEGCLRVNKAAAYIA